MNLDPIEQRHIDEYRAGLCRPICAKRKRKIQKRGVRIEWSPFFSCFVWYPEPPYPKKT